jgi:hypothetical protein
VADLSVRRIALVAGLVGALVGGAVAGVVTAVSASGSSDSAGASSGNAGSVATVAVVRTDLTTTQQVAGSISYDGSYSISAPSGNNVQAVTQAQEAVAKDQLALSSDEQAESDASNADNQTTAMGQSAVDGDQSTLHADQGADAQDCAGSGVSAQVCDQDGQKVAQDQTQLAQAQAQLASAQAAASATHDEDQGKIAADEAQLADDQASLGTEQQTEQDPGTTYTYLPKVGDVIDADQPVYSLNDEPVPLLYGSVAAYRAFYVGMSDGADVGELTQDLIALGYGSGLGQSNHYSSATAAAVGRWQSALGLPATGVVLLGAAVFEPGPIRVTTVTPSVGASVGGSGGGGGETAGGGGAGGSVLTATSNTPIVTVDLPVTEEYLVKPGDAVSIVLPNGSSTVGGHVESLGTVAACSTGAGSGGGGGVGTGAGSGSADQSPCASGGSTNTPTVPLTITMDGDPAGANLDQAPVDVTLTTQKVDDVLAVPVNALLALSGGGFGVDVVRGGVTRLIGVTTGIYDSTLVQVSGSGLGAGMRVEVPSS